MGRQKQNSHGNNLTLSKCSTGIAGLDDIIGGGLPQGRTTLVCGGAGCGKTLLGMEFLVRGALQYDQPGVFFAFEETESELIQNTASLGFDVQTLVEQRRLALEHISIDRSEIVESAGYDLEGLFVRLEHAIRAIGAQRVVLDTIETLFAGLANTAILRAELRRLFRWLKDRGLTAVITGERGAQTLTRHGLEEYVSDCVLLLDHRVSGQIATRRLRVVKYRGSVHGTNEFPFLIGEQGVTVLPITSLTLTHEASTQRVSMGIPRLDTMLGGEGVYRGSTVLVSGTAGSGKTSVATQMVEAACRRGERCLYFAFEESPSQIMRNSRSISINLEPWVHKGLLQFQALRPSQWGLEMHLVAMYNHTIAFQPRVVVVDPISNLTTAGTNDEAHLMLVRLIDFFKSNHITSLFTSLTQGGEDLERTAEAVSSLTDTWLLLRGVESNGERNRVLYILKSRGMAHSNQLREFLLTDHGIELLDVYTGPEGVLTGTARATQEAREKAVRAEWQAETTRKQRELARKRQVMELQVAALRAEFEAAEAEMNQSLQQEEQRGEQLAVERAQRARLRRADQQESTLTRRLTATPRPPRKARSR